MPDLSPAGGEPLPVRRVSGPAGRRPWVSRVRQARYLHGQRQPVPPSLAPHRLYELGYRFDALAQWGACPAPLVLETAEQFSCRFDGTLVVDHGSGAPKNGVVFAMMGARVASLDRSHVALRAGKELWTLTSIGE